MQTTSNGTKVVRRAVGAAVTVVGLALLARWAAGVAGTAAATALAGAPLRADEVLGGLAAAVVVVLSAWLCLGLTLEVLAAVPGVVGDAARTASAVVTPRAVRRAMGLVLGVGIAAGSTPGAAVAAPPVGRVVLSASPLPDPAFAPPPAPGWSAERAGPSSPTSPTSPTSASPPTSRATPRATASAGSAPRPTTVRSPLPVTTSPPPEVPDPRWVATTPTVRHQPDVRLLRPAPTTSDAVEVVVRRGDTLWSIAARHLGPHPSDTQIADAWPAWHEANLAVIGDDPDVLLPGQVLRAPVRVAS